MWRTSRNRWHPELDTVAPAWVFPLGRAQITPVIEVRCRLLAVERAGLFRFRRYRVVVLESQNAVRVPLGEHVYRSDQLAWARPA